MMIETTERTTETNQVRLVESRKRHRQFSALVHIMIGNGSTVNFLKKIQFLSREHPFVQSGHLKSVGFSHYE